MTSPNLPFVPSGLIWDGITEYQNSRPEGIVAIWLLRMSDDSSRRYTEYYGTTSPMEGLVHLSTQEDAWETIGVTYENATLILRYDLIAYMDYDGSISPEPVNQIPHFQAFKSHAARLMHQLDATIGHHSLQAAEEDDRETIRETIRDMIGAAWIKYQEWAVIDPEELIIGGNNDGKPTLGTRY